MTRRVFTRRRQAVRAALLTMRLALWLGLPVALGAHVFEWLRTEDLPVVGSALLLAVVAIWSLSAYRVHELTGEWRFY